MKSSEVLNMLIDYSICEVLHKEEAYLNAFISYVKKISGTLYNELFLCLQKEPLEHSVLLRTQFLSKSLVPNSFISKFYEILKKYDYRNEEEILKCMKDISVWHGEENIDFWEKTPWIKEINHVASDHKFSVKTIARSYSFVPSREMFQEEIEDIKRKRKGQNKMCLMNSFANGYNINSFSHFDYKCHVVTYDFSLLHPESYAVTAICPYSFNNHYWLHSYNVSKDFSSVLDLSNGIVMPYQDYIKLVQPIVLNQIQGKNIMNCVEEIRNSSWNLYSSTKSAPLKMLAFYNYDALSEEQREEKYGSLLRKLSKLK